MARWVSFRKMGRSSVYGKCLIQLQRTRGILAVRIAAERKHTSLDVWRYYQETEDLMLRGIMRLQADYQSGQPAPRVWVEIADTLQCILSRKLDSNPRDAQARALCEEIHGVLAALNETAFNRGHCLSGPATLPVNGENGKS